jgi:hypothetical protein
MALGGFVGMLAPFLFQCFTRNLASVAATMLRGALIGRAVPTVLENDRTL